MNLVEHIGYWLYCYVPRFMTERLYFRKANEDDSPPDFSAPLGPEDFVIEIKFFNLFSYPVGVRSRRLDPSEL